MSNSNTNQNPNLSDSPDDVVFGLRTAILRRESPETQQAMGDDLLTNLGEGPEDAASKKFPNLPLPPEIRNMVYWQAVVQHEPIIISLQDRLSRDDALISASRRRRHEYYVLSSIRTFASLSLISRNLHQELAQIYFAKNTFEFEDLDSMLAFIGLLHPDSRRAIATVRLRWTGTRASYAFQALATCIGLRSLHITLDHTYPTTRVGRTNARRLAAFYDCLKIKGLTHVSVRRNGRDPPENEHKFLNLDRLLRALQELKEPQSPLRLAYLNKKDYPTRETTTMDTVPEGNTVPKGHRVPEKV